MENSPFFLFEVYKCYKSFVTKEAEDDYMSSASNKWIMIMNSINLQDFCLDYYTKYDTFH